MRCRDVDSSRASGPALAQAEPGHGGGEKEAMGSRIEAKGKPDGIKGEEPPALKSEDAPPSAQAGV